ncbi:MAG TPA: alpha/beta hydrolase [Acidimicrobiales bacterium]|jgi:pimeloyl-ACP methyl ester carboxylesterase|nr:alpha/beta hydrolase [Acidimicrobiales bacterium]
MVLRSYGDSRLFGESYGSSEVRVVWLHGWGRSAQDFTLAANALAECGIGSVALDLPGFGASPVPEASGGARHYAALLRPALGEIASGPLVLVGHSFGGRVAVVLAAEHPELVRSLVLTGVPLLRTRPPARPPLAYRSVRWLAKHHLAGASRLERARQKYGSSDYQRAHGVMRDVLVANVNESYEPELGRLTMPVAFIWGEGDREAPYEIATAAAALVNSPSTLLELTGVGHFVPLEAPGELVDAVVKALHQ